MRHFTVFAVALALAFSVCSAGIRSTGKYCGVVIFDRWDTCTLYDGVYVMYISKSAKEQLRSHAGECVQINATKVFQPINPGDGLISAFRLLGPPPKAPDWDSPLDGLALSVRSIFNDGEIPVFVIRVSNTTEKPIKIRLDSLAPTLLAKKGKISDPFSPSDGPSEAVITRAGLWIGPGDGPRLIGGNDTWKWTVTSPRTLAQETIVQPKGQFEVTLSFTLPAGEYDLLAGYGNGECIASNLVGFDVRPSGRAAIVPAKPSTATTRLR